MNRSPAAPNLRPRMMDQRRTVLDLNSWAMNRGQVQMYSTEANTYCPSKKEK